MTVITFFMIFYFKTGDKYKFSEFVNKLRKENVQSRARLTNHSDHDVIVKPEKDYSEKKIIQKMTKTT